MIVRCVNSGGSLFCFWFRLPRKKCSSFVVDFFPMIKRWIISIWKEQICKKLDFDIKKSKHKQLLYVLNNCNKTYFVSYRRRRNVAKRNMMLMTRDIEKAAIQLVQADTSVVNLTFRRPSVQKYLQALINYKRFCFDLIQADDFYIFFHICHHTNTFRWIYHMFG